MIDSDKLMARLRRDINSIKSPQTYSSMQEISWQYEEGVLISGEEAELFLKILQYMTIWTKL